MTTLRQVVFINCGGLACLGLLAAVLPLVLGATQVGSEIVEYAGLCDASAGAAISPTLFIVASDEDNRLRIFRRDTPGAPVQEFDVSAFLKVGPQQETDIEGAARIGNRIYWITSHGANRKGEPRHARHRFFATDVALADGRVTLTTVGAPYEDLLDELGRVPGLEDYGFRRASKTRPGQAEITSQPSGLNIEGLGGTPQRTLLIAFRGPVHRSNAKALVVPLNNPAEVVRGIKPEFGTPISLSLEGLGVRSIEYVDAIGKYLIIAGPRGDKRGFRLYEWEAAFTEEVTPIEGVDFDDLRPEALIAYPGERAGIQILSDDGTRRVEGRECKRARHGERRFRSMWAPLRWRNDHLKTDS